MRLSSLELAGFKSFAKKANLDFNTQVTAIVGPNGSGKSNTAEAFRFVLGEQSIKSLRGKKGEDLIFNGSGTNSKANRASVKVAFDNKDRTLNIDFDEVIIERVVNRDGTNEYYINKSAVRLKDIAELLASANIGSSGHHIISQGEADRILNASPKERREMLEDALGLKVYQYKRTESEKKLNKTEENLKQVESLRREIAPHIKFLKKQVDKLAKAEEMRVELSGKYSEYLKREDIYITRSLERIKSERGPLEDTHKQCEEAIIEAKRVLAESESGADHSAIMNLENDLRGVQREKDELVRSLGRLEGSIEGYERELTRLQKTESDEGVIGKALVRSLMRRMRDLVSSALQTEDLQYIKDSLNQMLGSVDEFLTEHIESEADTSIVDELREKISALITERGDVERKMKELEESENALNHKMAEQRHEIEKGQNEARESERTLFEAMTKKNELAIKLNTLKSDEERLVRAKNEFERELQEGAVLVGREIFNYTEVSLDEQAILNEDRTNQENRRRDIERIKIRLEDMGGGSGEEIHKEYKEVTERDEFLAREIEDLTNSREKLQELIVELGQKLEEEFTTGVQKINTQFHEFFTLMFGGGSAGIFATEERKRRRKITDDLLGEMPEEGEGDEDGEVIKGIDVDVKLPHKKTKGLMMLSGGERALTSIALLFAISQVNPPPFIILDETDAALDEANSRKYGDMIEALAKHSQLILITHNRETMSRAGILYGVTMGSDGASKLLSVAFDEAVGVAK